MAAYENYEYNMNLIEDMFRHIAKEAFGKTEFKVKGHTVDFAKPWTRISMSDAVKNKFGIDFRTVASVEEANAHLQKIGVTETAPSIGEALVAAFELVEPLTSPSDSHREPAGRS